MKYPENITKTVAEVVESYPENTKCGITEAIRLVRDLDDFKTWVDELVNGSIQDLFYDLLHKRNVKLRKAAGFYGQPPKVIVGLSSSVAEVSRQMLEQTQDALKKKKKKNAGGEKK